MDKTTVVVLGGIGIVGAGMIFNQVSKHTQTAPPEAPKQVTTQNYTPSPAASVPVVEEEPAQPPGPSQEELDEQTIRAIYALREKAAGVCKVSGIADAGLSAQLAISLFQSESGLMARELEAHNLAQLRAPDASQDDFGLSNATVGDKDLWTFLQDNKIIPVVEYTNNPALGAAFINTGGQKALVFYASPEKNTDGNTGTSFNLSFNNNGNGFNALLEALTEDGVLKQTGSILLYFDDSRLGDPEWKLHTFKSGEKSFEMIEGLKQTFMPAPHNPCTPGAP